jgi:hypothetical protein
VKIQYAGVPLLAEIKRAGSRSLDGFEFYQSTMIEVLRARCDLFRQAAYLFAMHPRQQSVVLAACSSVYWSCMVASKQDVMERVALRPDDDFEPDDDDTRSDEEFGQVGDDQGEELFDDDFDQLDMIGRAGGSVEGPPPKCAQPGRRRSPSEPDPFEPEEDYLEPEVGEADLALVPTQTWTGLLCLDTGWRFIACAPMWTFYSSANKILVNVEVDTQKLGTLRGDGSRVSIRGIIM